MHRFDGLDLLTLLVGLSLLGFVAWRLWCLRVAGRDPEPAEGIPRASRYWDGVDLGNKHTGLSVYDSWEERFIHPPNRGKSRPDAQFMLYQMLAHPDETITYIANEDQADRVFLEAQQMHDDAMQAWLDTREPGQQIPRMTPPGPMRFVGTTPLDHDDRMWQQRGPVPPEYQFYNWANDPDA